MPIDSIAPLIGAVVRAAIILAGAWALTSIMWRASASTRHFVWSCAIAGAALIPVVTMVVPDWQVAAPPALTTLRSAIAPSSTTNAESGQNEVASPRQTAAQLASPARVPAAEVADGPSYAAIGLMVWAAGSAAILLYLILGAVAAWWMRRSAPAVSAPWMDEAAVLAEALEVPGPIAFVESANVTMPMVSGLWRPLVVIPRRAAQWSEDRLRVVVLHELAHIKRRDCLTQALAQVVCAAYWFNPLVWVAARRLRTERERACDDFVLTAGTKGSEYASHLLDIARAMQSARFSPTTATSVAMARRSQLEGRLMAILDPDIRRSSALSTRLAAVALLLLISIPLAAVRLSGPPAVGDRPQAVATDLQPGGGLRSPTPVIPAANQAQGAGAKPLDDRRSSRVTRDELVRTALSGALFEFARDGDLDGITAMLDAGADVNSEVRGDGSALIGAARGGHLAAARLLIARGADVNLGVHGDGSPLIMAARNGHMDIVKVLLDRGADINLSVRGDGNPLIAAAAAGHAEVVRFLLDRGADIHRIVEGDENALIGASEHGHLDVVRLLVGSGADVNARIPADVYTFDPNPTQGRGHSIYAGQEWRTALSMARRANHADVVQYLLSVGAHD
jgi:beta-lactamase regulating signal transducer with metallopeptidase domain/ankyrin repeat protein